MLTTRMPAASATSGGPASPAITRESITYGLVNGKYERKTTHGASVGIRPIVA